MLKSKLTEILSNPETIQKYRHNLENFESRKKQFDWDNIFNMFKSIEINN